ncbi:M23 family metallopeptidase [Mesorhizobium sp. YM1C-6-2]|uniref:M23 family metallopeptidase n=1 Tax=Mesorhizobium sp. YM1C-6-2 TaxID=1827501 RepID=UPI000EF1948D|nr:M23 family metallopeptidase [Mesorhizobium sp. YM1C-6-2]RLP24847.1 M23 family metallopeptidase [Mesorhizobium sp. YM1C-6-2]
MAEANRSTVFGKRNEPHTVIIARGDDIRHFQVRPWLVAVAGSAFAAMAIGYLLATTYLVLRDDLIDATTARQARLQQAYEDRISALRAQVDRITSRQMLDQQLMETKVGELLERQTQLTERHGRLAPITDRFGADAAALPASAPLPPDKPEDGWENGPDLRATLDTAASGQPVLAGASAQPFSFWSTRNSPSVEGESSADRADRLFVAINQSLRTIESEQLSRINTLAQDAYQTADAISDVLEDAGLRVEAGSGIGGPLVPIDNPALFDAKVKELDEALEMLDRMKSEARRLPIANPSPGHSVSSTFGVRKDPLLGSPALHSGMDFRAPMGSEAHVTAPGTVVSAGWNGGYGRMVEVEHADGFTTRYGHLSKILVKKGQQLSAGDIVGKVGSTGRSTGPHLHYEVRRNGEALNPSRFLKAGRKVSQYL